MALDQEIHRSKDGAVHRLMRRFRAFMGRHLVLLMLYRFVVVSLGFIFMVMGLIMLVTPGPGWLFIFLGMGLWGTEFHWAHRFNVWTQSKVLSFFRSWEARRYKKRKNKQDTLWQRRNCSDHYCPTGQHYHH